MVEAYLSELEAIAEDNRVDVILVARLRVFRKPLRREVVRRQTALSNAIDVEVGADDQVRQLARGRDPVAKRHPRPQL